MLFAAVAASLLLLVGLALRAAVPVFRWLFVPASVLAGLIGLGLVTFCSMREVEWTAELSSIWRGWPGPLIAVVFAGLLLEHGDRPIRGAMRSAASAGIYTWIIVLGQVVIGLAVGWLVITRSGEVPAAFGQLIETGFAGGHGTAAAMGDVFETTLEFPDGRDLGLAMATIGLIYGVVSGLVFVNIGVRRGWANRSDVTVELISGLEPRHDPQPASFARVRGEVLDPMAMQITFVGAAMALGLLMQWGFISATSHLPQKAANALDNVPLFLFTLIGGWMVRRVLTALRLGNLIDPESVRRIVAVAMEFLIVAAIASLRIEAVTSYGWPFVAMCLAGFAWSAVCLLFIAPRILPRGHWFELALINYGMSTATTAQGMMLLRIVDPDLETRAAEDYALAAPLSAPFVGGGVITLSLPVLLLTVPTLFVAAVGAIAIVALIGAGRAVREEP